MCQVIGVMGSIFTGPSMIDSSCVTLSGNHVAVSSAGSVYASFADNTTPCEVRAIVANNTSVTVAGTATCGYSGDGGPATSAEIMNPEGLATDGAGNLYISDAATERVRIVYSPVIAARSVGGIAEQPDVSTLAPAATSSGGGRATPFELGGGVALAAVLTLGAVWYTRRRRAASK